MNTIKIYLAESGRVAELKKDFPLYQWQFQNKLLNVYVPTSLLAPEFVTKDDFGQIIGDYVATTAVKIGMRTTTRSGEIKVSQNYYMRYLKKLIYQGVEYAMYERKLPQEFTLYAGQGANSPQLTINVVNIQTDIDPPIILNITASQTCSFDVMPSSDLDNDGAIEPTEMELLQARVNEIDAILPLKQDKVDDALETSSKEVVRAINDIDRFSKQNSTRISTNSQQIAINRNNIDFLLDNMTYAETYIGQMSGSVLPTNEQLSAFVVANTSPSREPRNADTIMFILHIAGDTDKTYKYIFSQTGWNGYEIPAIENASNGTKGILQGTYAIGSTNETLVDISGGQILNIYVKDTNGVYRNIREYANSLNTEIVDIINGDTVVGEAMRALEDGVGNNIVNTYITKLQGVTKAEMRDYALPREFNDVYFISSAGYLDVAPSEPATGIQFSITTASVGDAQIFQIQKQNTADFELSSKNGYGNNIFVSASQSTTATFRLTTRYRKAGDVWKNLNIELSTPVVFTAGEIHKVTFSSPFLYLGNEVISLTDGDFLQQTLEVITQTSTQTTFNVYSNEVYPSTFNLTTQSYTMASAEQTVGETILLGIDGVVEAGRVVFEVQNAVDFEQYKTNQREFLMLGYLPVVGVLDKSMPVAITFGNTTYQVYSFMNGGNSPITIGDLMSVSAYDINVGYRFFSKMMFLQTADITGFAIMPPTITASQLTHIIDDTDGVVVSLDPTGTMLQLQLNATITNRLARTLVTPMSAPATIELVAVDDGNSQTMLGLGDGLYIANGLLNATGGGGGTSDYQDLNNKPILNTNNTASQTPSSSETINGTINLHKISKTGNATDLNGLEDLLPKAIIMGV